MVAHPRADPITLSDWGIRDSVNSYISHKLDNIECQEAVSLVKPVSFSRLSSMGLHVLRRRAGELCQ